MDKVKKPILSAITAYYQGGTKLRADLPITREAAEAEMESARKNMRDARFETVEVNEGVAESYLYLSRSTLLFYNIATPVTESLIKVIPATTLIK